MAKTKKVLKPKTDKYTADQKGPKPAGKKKKKKP